MENYEELTVNLRSAFRLLAHYNERIISLMRHIGEKLGLNSSYDQSHWYEPVLQGNKNRNNLTNGKDRAISWLPMFFHEFHFENKSVQFSIFIQSDTGPWKDPYWDWNDEIDNYTDIESSKTRILFAITTSKNWEAKIVLVEKFDEFLRDENKITFNKKTIICKAFGLEDFKDEKTTNSTLKNYVEYIKKEGINIEYKE